MAAKINAGADVKRSDVFGVDPFEVIVREEIRGRCKPPSDEQIVTLAESLLDHGQQQPVRVRKIEENRLQLISGYTRTAAARLIREGFVDSEGKKRKDREFKLQCMISTANDEKSFILNVVENEHRNMTSPIDDALNQERLRSHHMMSDAAIAKLYGYKNQNKVGRLRRLLGLPDKVQNLVHDGNMTVEAALLLLDAPEDERDEILKQSQSDDGKVNGTAVRQTVREHILRDSEEQIANKTSGNGKPSSNGREKPKFKARTVSEIRKFFEGIAESDESESDPALIRFAGDMLKFIGGRMGDQGAWNALNRILDSKRAK